MLGKCMWDIVSSSHQVWLACDNSSCDQVGKSFYLERLIVDMILTLCFSGIFHEVFCHATDVFGNFDQKETPPKQHEIPRKQLEKDITRMDVTFQKHAIATLCGLGCMMTCQQDVDR